MTAVIGFFLTVGILALVVVGPLLAIMALVRVNRTSLALRRLTGDLEILEARVGALTRRLAAREATASASPERVEAAGPAPVPPMEAQGPATQAPRAAIPSPRPMLADAVMRAAAAARPPGSSPSAGTPPAIPPSTPPSGLRPAGGYPPSRGEFATNLGPKILAATGALAFFVFAALFVKYAWDNNWVGPTGRVLFGAVLGLGLVAAGVRLLGQRYRPLGQAMAGAGVASLYTSAFAAHGFYHLIGRSAAGLLMVAITASAVVLAARLDARLLAALAWIGGYMTPILLSTGEDRVWALYGFLLLLDVGALVIDHRKPWPETVPMAMIGTVMLWGAWYARFFRPERFEAAAFGIVLFTALFAFGMARKERGAFLSVAYVLGGMGVGLLAAGADRPEALLLLSIGLGGAALWSAAAHGVGLAAVAAFTMGFPLMAWALTHYRSDAFGIAAAWVVVAGLLLTLGLGRPGAEGSAAASAAAPAATLEGGVLSASGLATVLLVASTDNASAVLGFLLAQAGVAILARLRWDWAALVGVGASALAALTWIEVHGGAARDQSLLVAVPVAGLHVVALLVRGLLLRRKLATADVVAHLATALFLWMALFRVLHDPQPRLLGIVAVWLAIFYLVLGLVARRPKRASQEDLPQVRVLLGLAAAFLTVAIPVQMGLNGITLAWAAEGVVLLALGARFASPLTRAGGYAVLALTVLRLFARHVPLHRGAFDPVLNASFGTWLFVIGALGLALLVARRARAAGEALDRGLAPVLAVAALLLLFGVLTGETNSTFAQKAQEAVRRGDAAAIQDARRVGGLALSVLWTVFATALLAGGLALRNHPLFYSAYALFAITAAKVVVWDLHDFSLPYRMLSFLALGLLLMAGAFLNLRFRERLMAAEPSP